MATHKLCTQCTNRVVLIADIDGCKKGAFIRNGMCTRYTPKGAMAVALTKHLDRFPEIRNSVPSRPPRIRGK